VFGIDRRADRREAAGDGNVTRRLTAVGSPVHVSPYGVGPVSCCNEPGRGRFPDDPTRTSGAAMRTVTVGLAAAVLVLVAGGTTVGQDTKDKLDAKLLVGKWTPDDEAKRDKMTIEFLKDGKLAIGFKFGEAKEFKIDGTYKLDGDKLTVKMSFMGEEKSEVMTVNKLTAKTLVTTDEKGKKDTLSRIAAKTEKKDDKKD